MIERTVEGLAEKDIVCLGKALSAKLFRGAFLAFFGDLGAGKTTFTKAIAKGLGIENVLSPTFTIVREYYGRLPIFHFDAYRLASEDELFAIGFDDYIAQNGVIIMEWSENVLDALPNDRLELHLTGSGNEKRKLCLRAFGTGHEILLDLESNL